MTIQHMRIACWIPYATKHTLRICNTYCFSTATNFPIKQLNVMLYVRCSLSGSDLYVLPEKRVEFIAVCSQYFIWIVLVSSFYLYRPVFLNRRAAARYGALALIIPGCERFSWNLSFFMIKYFIVEIF